MAEPLDSTTGAVMGARWTYGGEGAVGPPGGHREAPPLPNPVPDSLYIPGRHPVLEIV